MLEDYEKDIVPVENGEPISTVLFNSPVPLSKVSHSNPNRGKPLHFTEHPMMLFFSFYHYILATSTSQKI